jgi:hypothetical protein
MTSKPLRSWLARDVIEFLMRFDSALEVPLIVDRTEVDFSVGGR